MRTAGLKILIRILGALPPDLRSRLGHMLGMLLFLIPSRERAVAVKQIQLFLPEENPTKVTRAMFANLGQTLFESLNAPPYLKDLKTRFTLHNQKFTHELLSSNRPIVALTAHTGNWDLMAAYMVAIGANLSTIGKPARNEALQTALSDMREAYGIRMLWRTGKDGTRDIIKELKNNRVVAALIDQDTRVSSSWIPFFGQPAKSPSGIIALAKRYDAIIATCFNVRTGLNSFELFVDTIDCNLTVDEILLEYNRRLESIIRQRPAQWVWLHKRWRSPNETLTMSTSEYLQFLDARLGEIT